jgi:DDE superfamily endonuclease
LSKFWEAAGKLPIISPTVRTMDPRVSHAVSTSEREQLSSSTLFTIPSPCIHRILGGDGIDDTCEPNITTYTPFYLVLREDTFETNPQCLNIYAGISKCGITGVHVVAGTSKHTTKYVTKKGTSARNITSAQYGDVLRKTLLPCGEKLLGQKYGAWYLQQDNDPSHKCAQRVTKRWAKEKGFKVEVLPNWPPNSPDLNIIENVWAWVQREVDKLGCENFEEFHQSVVQTLAKVPASMIANLYASMKERVKLVVEREGGFTGY